MSLPITLLKKIVGMEEEIETDSTWTKWLDKSISHGREIFEIISTISLQWGFKEISYLYPFIRTSTITHFQEEKLKCDIDMVVSPRENITVPLDELKLVLKYGNTGKYLFSDPFDLAMLEKHCNIKKDDIIMRQMTPQTMRPAFGLWRDRDEKKVVLLIRGTKSLHDLITDLMIRPRKYGDSGYIHGGVLEAAEWFNIYVKPMIEDEVRKSGYALVICGHSLGAGVGVILAMMWIESFPSLKCFAVACPAILTRNLSESCKDYVTSYINRDDFGCRLSANSIENLRLDVSEYAKSIEDHGIIWNSLYYLFSKESVVTTIHHEIFKDQLYPAGKVVMMKNESNFVNMSVGELECFETLCISRNLLEDHRWYTYEANLKSIIEKMQKYSTEK